MNNLLLRMIRLDERLVKLSLRNMHLTPYKMSVLLNEILKPSRIYSLDISNKNSQTINRLGTQYGYLEEFFAKNQSIGVIKMDNLNITDECLEKIVKGMLRNGNASLKIVSLGSNMLTYRCVNFVFNMMTRVGLSELNLSNNPLNPQFFLSFKNLRSNSVKHLDLSSTSMNSQSLIHLLSQLVENKNLETLNLNNNDFSHHWFNKMEDVLKAGLAVRQLSFVNCGIKNFHHLFEGVAVSRNLTKLNLNYNLVNIESEDI